VLPSITFSGLATGLDSASIIEQLIAAERQPIVRLQQRQRVYDTQADKLRSLQSKLEKLQSAAADLGERDDLLAATASSSDEGVFTASIGGAAALGPTSIHVDRLASAQKTYSDAFGDDDAAGLFGAGTLTLAVGDDDPVDVTIEATDTLSEVASKINASGADVTAGIVFDGTDYRLRVTGNDTGAARGITFTESGTTLGLDDPANEVQAATDASFTVDGFAMTRSTNSFSDALPGVTITLTGESPDADPSTLSVSRDPDTVRDRMQGFVDAYNDVMRSINAEFAYTGTPKGPESLSGDFTLRGIQSRLRSMVGGVVAGTSGAYTTLASVGIETSTDGTLELDAGAFDAALATDPSAVADLFAGDGAIEGFVASFDSMIESHVDSSEGILSQRIDSIEGRRDGLDDQIDRLELRIEGTEERLRLQFSTLEQLVSSLQNQGSQMTAALSGLAG